MPLISTGSYCTAPWYWQAAKLRSARNAAMSSRWRLGWLGGVFYSCLGRREGAYTPWDAGSSAFARRAWPCCISALGTRHDHVTRRDHVAQGQGHQYDFTALECPCVLWDISHRTQGHSSAVKSY